MHVQPKKITVDQIAEVMVDNFKTKAEITCYVGSNAATPTASLQALTKAVKSRYFGLPFIKMVHLLLQGPVPYVETGLQDRIMAYSIFSGGDVRQAANEGRAYYLPCTLANLDSLIGKGRKYEPDVVILKVCRNEFTGTNSPDTIRKNRPFISVNTAIGVDLFGNVWADFIDPRRYHGGVGGQPDFIRALNDRTFGTPIIAIKSVTNKGESKITKMHPPGIGLTASAFDGLVIITEYGIADLRELTSGEKAMAIASITHPDFRDDFLRSVYNDPLFTKPIGYTLDKNPPGVHLYNGTTGLDEE